MKKIISLILCLVLLFASSVQSISVFALEQPTIKCDDVTCTPGDTITVDVTVSGNPGFCYLEMTPVYSQELTLTKVTNGEIISDFTKGKQYIWVADEDITDNDVLMTFAFNVAETVSPGNYSVGFTLRTCANYNEQNVDFNIVTGKITVKEKPVSVTGISFESNTASVKTGQTIVLTPIISPDNAANKKVTWKSSDETVATVSDGIISGVKKGTAVITVTTEDGGFAASCTVTVECSHTNTTIHPAETSTCIKHGHAEYYTCDDCGMITSGSDALLPYVDHTGGAATCKDKAVCEVCGVSYGDYGAHNLIHHIRVEADCSKDGNIEYWTCETCGKYFSDSEGKDEITKTEIPAKGHKSEVISGKTATCTETGLTDGAKCSVCGEILTAQKEIPATGHDYVSTVKDATCTANGSTVYTCSACGDSYTETIPATGHKSEVISGKAATCTETGLTDGAKCSVCGEILTAQKEIPASGHTDADSNNICDNCGAFLGLVVDSENNIKLVGDDVKLRPSMNADEIKANLKNKNISIVDKNDNVIAKNAKVGTGCKIQILDDNNQVVSEYEVIVSMDINGDGSVTAADARSALRCTAKLDILEGVYKIAADINGDAKITAANARAILRVSARLDAYKF